MTIVKPLTSCLLALAAPGGHGTAVPDGRAAPPRPRRATTYYVSPRGSGRNPGTSPSASWRTVARVNRATLRPGDSVRFARGGSWPELLIPPSSGRPGAPITFGAYATGEAPVITARRAAAGWKISRSQVQ